MTSQPSNEERNRLRLQAWEQRNLESSQAKEQSTLNVHLFGQPYKIIKSDELSSRIQRMLAQHSHASEAHGLCAAHGWSDQVVSESPEIKPSPQHHSLPDALTLQKSIQGKAVLPQFLEQTKTNELQCVEGILREMTCSWPPLLSGIHSPPPDYPPKTQGPVKEINPHKQEEPSHSHQSSSVSSLSAADSVCSSDSESSKSVSESGTDDPPVSSSSKSEPAPASVASEDWQLYKLIQFRQQNYRSKSQWVQSPKLSPPKNGFKQPTVSVFSPARDSPNLLSSNQKTVHFTTSKKSCLDTPESTETSDARKQIEKTSNGGVCVHFNQTSTKQGEGDWLKDETKVKKENKSHKQSQKCIVSESEITTNHLKNEKKISHDQCKSRSTTTSDLVSPSCSCGKSKAEARKKTADKLSQKDKRTKRYSLNGSKDTQSLVVKIDLNLLSKIPGTTGSLETNTEQHFSKEDKPHEVTNSRKKVKEDQSCQKKKQKLHDHNPTLHSARLENPTSEKRAKKSDEKFDNYKHCSENAPQLNKETVKCQNKKSSGKNTEESHVQKPTKETPSNRPLLKFENRHYPVKHYIKEAKRLKHKADAELEKLCKTFHYLSAALFFIESGIAMERDPQISMSSYTMFAETVELVKFVLKISHSEDPSPAENDLIALW
ncbi:hypothetical protein WMY93_021840 [Mugilogobius chulae]|uniref:AF4/FMR2 C-terminal homology domain-containing protein n=1 Tax=Mugilogobius chulae TaxID=88201 RepID=A0AAW0NF02_9GOBI